MQCFYFMIGFKAVAQLPTHACSQPLTSLRRIPQSSSAQLLINTSSAVQPWCRQTPARAGPCFGSRQLSQQENQGVWMYICRAAWQDRGGAGSQRLPWRKEQLPVRGRKGWTVQSTAESRFWPVNVTVTNYSRLFLPSSVQ